MQLPYFKYHPDPISTGSIKKSNRTCESCEEQRGFIYTGSFYSKHSLNDICPWCIASGFAADKYDGSFISQIDLVQVIDTREPKRGMSKFFLSLFSVNGSNSDKSLRANWREELFYRTPGFSSYQEEIWLSCCDTPCEFRGLATVDDFRKISEEEKLRLFQNSSVCAEYLEELQEGENETKHDYYFKFVCASCNEIRFLEDLD